MVTLDMLLDALLYESIVGCALKNETNTLKSVEPIVLNDIERKFQPS
jgi:hypothetical protein